MWLTQSPDRECEGLVASALLLLFLYAVQAFILSRIQDERHARSLYALIAAATVPICWGVSPGWHNPQYYPIATFLGWPVTIHVVPLWSFHRGLELRKSKRFNRWRKEALLHLFILVLVWCFVWGMVQLFLLGFMWI